MAVLESKRPVELNYSMDESCTVNKKLGIWDTKYVIILTHHLRVTWYRACALPILRFSTEIAAHLGNGTR